MAHQKVAVKHRLSNGRITRVRTKTLVALGVFLALLLSYIPSVHAKDGALAWAKEAGGNSLEEGNAIAVAAAGNIYATGYFKSTATFGRGEENQTNLTALSQDIFLAKYRPNGTLSWVRQSNASFAWGTAIGLDSLTNCYVLGYFGPTMTFNSGQSNQVVLNALANDIFLAKFDALGNFVWAKQAGGSSSESGQGLAVDPAGNCYITGRYGSNPITFGAGEPNETKLPGLGGNNGEDIFVAKYDPDGALVWAKSAGGAAGNGGSGIGVDAAGNSYVIGHYRGSSTFGPGESNQTIMTAPLGGKSEIFIAKFAPTGNLIWVRSGDGEEDNDEGNAIAVDSAGNSVATGTYRGRAPFGGTLNQTQLDAGDADDIFVVKHDTDGNRQWVKMAVGDGSQFALGVALDTNDNSYITGYGSSLVFGAEEPGEVSIGGSGLADVFAAMYGGDGLLKWAKIAGGSSDDRGQGIAWGAGNAHVTGHFGQTAIFGAGEPNQTILTSASSSDIFLAKFSSDAPAAAAPRIVHSGLLLSGKPAFTISGSPSGTYTVQRATTLTDPTWHNVATVTADSQGQATFQETDEALAFPAFYRVFSN